MNHLKRRTTYQYGTLVPESRKRGPDVWVYRFSEDNNGKRSRRKVIVGTLEELPKHADAERACQHLRLAANSEAGTASAPTMQGLIDRYIREVLRPCLDVPLGGVQEETAGISFHCAKSYRSVLSRYVSPRWETYKLSEFGRAEVGATVEQWLHSLLRSGRNPDGLAPKTVRSIFNIMKIVFKFGVKWGYLERNPMAEKRVELPRGSTKRLGRAVQLTAAQFLYLLPLYGLRERLAVAFAGWMGTRISEALGLKWGDLDLSLGVVTFRRGFVQGRVTPLKTEASRTDMSVPEEVLELLLKMGQLARSEVRQSKQAFSSKKLELAEDLVRQDQEINRLNREIFQVALRVGEDADTREWAMHMTLVARALERIGDNAVDIGEQTAFVVTGLFREFSDSSHTGPA